jgi:hypothetical protein
MFVFLILVLLVAVNARLILENVLRAQQIDDQIVSEANPRLNRTLIKEAVQILESFSNSNLTTIFPSVTVKDNEATEPILIEIQNATGIDGAAANLADLLREKGYQVSALSTAPSLQNQTTLFHKAGRAEQSRRIKEILEKEGWIVGGINEESQLQVDIRIVLGKG